MSLLPYRPPEPVDAAGTFDRAVLRLSHTVGRLVAARLAALGATRLYLGTDGKLMLGPRPVRRRARKLAARHREALRLWLGGGNR